jgi:hypothetical protein
VLIALIMVAARTSETSVDIQLRTRQYIPEDSELHISTRLNKFQLGLQFITKQDCSFLHSKATSGAHSIMSRLLQSSVTLRFVLMGFLRSSL